MAYKIPLFDLNFGQEEKDAVLNVLDEKWISAGSKTAAFEQAFSTYVGSRYGIALTNGTAALHLAVLSLNIGEGDEVIVPSLTFAATVNAVKYTRAKPVFADVKSCEDLTISPEDIERKITSKTKAIMVMHYGGFSCDMEKIQMLAKTHNLYIIEDAAHAPGATYQNKKLGCFGNVSAFSFFSNKNITTAEGGMLLTDDESIADRVRLLRSHGMTTSSYDRAKGHATKYDISELGFNYRIDDIRSAIGLVQFEKLDADLQKRKELVKIYHEGLRDINELILPFEGKHETSSNYIFPVVLRENCGIERDEFRNRLDKEYGIQTSMHYPPVHHFTQYYDESIQLPITDQVAASEVTLPLYYRLTQEQIQYVCSSIKDIFGR